MMIAELANGFDDLGHDVGLLTLADIKEDHYRVNRGVQRIPLQLIWNSRSVWHRLVSLMRRLAIIRSAVKSFNPDIVVSFIDQNNVRVLAALAGTRIPVIVSERVDPRRHAQSRLWNLARRLLYPMASLVVVQTEIVAVWGARIVGNHRVRVIQNLIRDLPLPPSYASRDPMSFLAVGRLDKQKGFDLLISGFASSGLAKQGVSLTILGEGPERQSLQALACELGVDHAVDLHGIRPDPETWMAQASVYVLPSRYEGFPNALLEAMAMGCPSIATDCDTGPGEIIHHDVNGWLIPVEDADALSKALSMMFDDHSLRARLGAESIKVRDRYSKLQILSEWENAIHEIIKKP